VRALAKAQGKLHTVTQVVGEDEGEGQGEGDGEGEGEGKVRVSASASQGSRKATRRHTGSEGEGHHTLPSREVIVSMSVRVSVRMTVSASVR